MPVVNEHIALDKKTLFDESGKQRPALDIYWIEKVDFIKYKPFPSVDDAAAVDEWADRLTFIEQDLHRLLCQPYHKFWSQMVFDSGLHLCLDSYLSYAPRGFDIVTGIPEQHQEALKHVHKLVFTAFLRIATHKESKENFISSDVFGDILYENFLFDVPKLMDLCVLYGAGNKELLTKMLNNVFKMQPKYTNDLQSVIPTITEVFDNISNKCGVFDPKLPRIQQNVQELSIDDTKDIVQYIVDISQSLTSFMEIYPPVAELLQNAGFINSLAVFFEGVIPQLKKILKERQFESSELQKLLKKQLRVAKFLLVDVGHKIITTSCILPILEMREIAEVVEKKSKDFLDAIESILAEKLFVSHLNKLHSIEGDIEIIEQADQDKLLDSNRVRFILDGVRAAASTSNGKMADNKHKAAPEVSVNNETVWDKEEVTNTYNYDDYQNENLLQDYAGASTPSDVEISSLISSVQDIFNDVGEGFIEACLEEYNFDASKVIDNILQDTLPPSLLTIDRNLPRSKKPEENSLLYERRNIFDDDEFDVFSKGNVVDKSKVHQGKKVEETVFLDKSHIEDMKDVYTKLGYTYDDEYDDEYDDTYDTVNIGATDINSADELTDRRAFTTPRILQQKERKTVVSDGHEEEKYKEDVPQNPSPPKDEFIQNPAILREKREQRYQERQHAKGRHTQKQETVKGKPKGQGQDGKTKQARRNKESNKSQTGNHNRKAMASRKMAKGM